MSALLAHDRAKYEDLAAVPEYQSMSPGEGFAPLFVEIVCATGSVLDAGCCTGKGGLALHALGFRVVLCDYTDVNLVDQAKGLPFQPVRTLWDTADLLNGLAYDYVYCCDVLEHIPREFTMLTAQNLLRVAKRGVFLSIGLTQDVFGAWVGRPLHETVESFVWWRDRLKELGTVREARDLLHTGVYYVEPR
jgi:SAM-dependent methyltransferase